MCDLAKRTDRIAMEPCAILWHLHGRSVSFLSKFVPFSYARSISRSADDGLSLSLPEVHDLEDLPLPRVFHIRYSSGPLASQAMVDLADSHLLWRHDRDFSTVLRPRWTLVRYGHRQRWCRSVILAAKVGW